MLRYDRAAADEQPGSDAYSRGRTKLTIFQALQLDQFGMATAHPNERFCTWLKLRLNYRVSQKISLFEFKLTC